jgi:hypothetical protein
MNIFEVTLDLRFNTKVENWDRDSVRVLASNGEAAVQNAKTHFLNMREEGLTKLPKLYKHAELHTLHHVAEADI